MKIPKVKTIDVTRPFGRQEKDGKKYLVKSSWSSNREVIIYANNKKEAEEKWVKYQWYKELDLHETSENIDSIKDI